MALTFVIAALLGAATFAAGLWLGRQGAIAEIKAEVYRSARDPERREESIAFLQSFAQDPPARVKRGRR